MYPAGPLDVFAGQDLVVLARYDGSGAANVVVQGRAGGRNVRWSTPRNFPREERENAFVPRLWATQRIGWLAAEKRRNGGSSEIDDEIRRLGERFGIPTEFTSYLVQEPGRLANVGQGQIGGGGGMRGRAAGRAMPMTSNAPAAQAFETAKTASDRRDAKSLAAADATVESTLGSEVRRVGGKMFKREGDKWADVRMKSDLQVYKVKAYSRSYFTLLERIPELRESFMVGDKLIVAGKSVAIEVVDDARELTESELQSIAKNWQN
jgi:Ca-activated chloride channel family protein